MQKNWITTWSTELLEQSASTQIARLRCSIIWFTNSKFNTLKNLGCRQISNLCSLTTTILTLTCCFQMHLLGGIWIEPCTGLTPIGWGMTPETWTHQKRQYSWKISMELRFQKPISSTRLIKSLRKTSCSSSKMKELKIQNCLIVFMIMGKVMVVTAWWTSSRFRLCWGKRLGIKTACRNSHLNLWTKVSLRIIWSQQGSSDLICFIELLIYKQNGRAK